MECRRAFDVDLVACLLDRGRPEWQEFRDHYPTCAQCAAEVRTWTEFHTELMPAHPEPARLLASEDRPASLPADERHAIHEHVQACVACRDELTTLRTTDIPALVRSGTAVATPLPDTLATARRRRGRQRRPGEVRRRLRRLVVHPAFAYGIAIALLVPALAPHLRMRLRTQPMTAEAPTPISTAPREPAAVVPVAPPVRETVERHAVVPATDAIADDTLAGADHPKASALETRARATTPAGWSQLIVTPASSHVVAPRTSGLVLRFPVSVGAPTGLTELHLRDVTGGRELRERYAGPPADMIEMRVPGAWLVPGRYTVALHTGSEEAVATAKLVVSGPAP